MTYTVREALPCDINDIGAHMRPMDIAECEAVGRSPNEALLHGMETTEAYTVLYNDRPVGMFGIYRIDLEMAGVWALGTDEFAGNSTAFLRESLAYRDRLFAEYETLTNCVSSDNTVHIRWLTWLGAEFFPDASSTIGGLKFIPFLIQRK